MNTVSSSIAFHQSANHAISGEIFGKSSRFPRSEIFYPTLKSLNKFKEETKITEYEYEINFGVIFQTNY
jgi:hypothetical protein